MQFELKRGDLAGLRAFDLSHPSGWRAPFTLDAERRIVKVLSIGPHDDAYRAAKRRMQWEP